MLKIEKIKEEILNFDNSDSLCCYLAQMVTKKGDKNNCSRKNTTSCRQCLKLSLMELLEEYKEPIKLTQFEYEYLKFAKAVEYNFIARDEDGRLFLYSIKPWKAENYWDYEDRTTPVFAELFKFVKWENESPMLIEELLKCEVIENE